MFEAEDTKVFYRCPQCSYISPWKFILSQHAKLHHSALNIFCPSADVETYSCDLCPFKTRLKLDLLNHKKRECLVGAGGWRQTLPSSTCLHCGLKTASKLVQLVHSERHTNAESEWSVSKRQYGLFSCPFCTYCGASKDLMKAHYMHKHCMNLSRHVNEPKKFRQFKCEHCPFRCHLKSDLKKHFLFKHAKDEEISWARCQQCPFKSKVMAGLRRHMETHLPPDKVRWFHCDKCTVKSRRKWDLKQHILLNHS